MTYDRIVIWTSPTERFQKLYVFKDGALVDQMGIEVDNFYDTLNALIEKYSINRLDFSGTRSYSEGLANDFQEKSMLNFGVNDIRINYV